MKLMQLNLWGGKLDPQIKSLIHQEKPDILCLQEVMNIHGATLGIFVSLEQLNSQN